MKFITRETLATIEPVTKNGTYKLTLYRNGKPIFTKEYNSFAIAKAQETKYIKKFNL